MNALNVISPYRAHDMWVFDDPRVGLVQEPFVGGADELIDVWVRDFASPHKGFRVVFSSEPFPGHQWSLDWVRPEMSGNVYRCRELEAEGWLCPALLLYFETPPKSLFVQCSELPVPENP